MGEAMGGQIYFFFSWGCLAWDWAVVCQCGLSSAAEVSGPTWHVSARGNGRQDVVPDGADRLTEKTKQPRKKKKK